jgi:hypothetical protein
MRRRDFITALGGMAAAAWPLAARAQQAEQMRRIGVLVAPLESDREAQRWISALREGLEKLGWNDGRARSQPTCLSSSPQRSSYSSTSRPRRHSVSKSRPPCSLAPTR